MSFIRNDGSIQTSNVPGGDDGRQTYFGLVACQITKAFYVDDNGNMSRGATNPQMLYEAVVVGGSFDGSVLVNVRDGLRKNGGSINYDETTLRPNEAPTKQAQNNSKPTSQQVGEIVYVQFLDGNPRFPVIVGRGTHPLDGTKTGPTRAEGPRERSEFNGVFKEVTRNGDLILRRRGGKLDTNKNVFEPNETSQMDLVVEGVTAAKMTLSFPSGMQVGIDSGTDTVVVKSSGGASLKISGGKVGLGSEVAEVLSLLSDALGELSGPVGNLGYPLTCAPQLIAIKALLDQIKGGV